MPLYEKKWWKKMFKQEHIPKEDVLKDLATIIEFLEDVQGDVKQLLPLLNKVQNLEKERQVSSKNLTPVNLETQAKVFDDILERYQFFQNDVDINGIRMKQVATEFLKQAKKAGLKHLVEEKERDHKWKFNW
ncbi:MAG: hypothetical protein KKH52_02555 [Nanoarchaeota archaeon]|nr:hypothetical protein [Nanoarchaeota archaeon]MBU1622904.1 hypothetical protein [Nanoarchaeota archaeon]MBU1974254.1 hypothetical protein [Nanoarchaeota archaeon]